MRALPAALLATLLAAAPRPALAAGTITTNSAGWRFLADNQKKDGVVSLDLGGLTGMQYKVLSDGTGEDHPLPGTAVDCHYEGRTAPEFQDDPDGADNKFDSSYDRKRPIKMVVGPEYNPATKGMSAALERMVRGDKWQLFIPSELAFGQAEIEGKKGKKGIASGDVLVMTIELLKIHYNATEPEGGTTPADLKCNPATGDGCSEKDKRYIDEHKEAAAAELTAAAAELAPEADPMAEDADPEAVEWAKRRAKILQKMAARRAKIDALDGEL